LTASPAQLCCILWGSLAWLVRISTVCHQVRREIRRSRNLLNGPVRQSPAPWAVCFSLPLLLGRSQPDLCVIRIVGIQVNTCMYQFLEGRPQHVRKGSHMTESPALLAAALVLTACGQVTSLSLAGVFCLALFVMISENGTGGTAVKERKVW